MVETSSRPWRLAPILLLAACTAPDRSASPDAASGGESGPAKPVEERAGAALPWTRAFQDPAVLLASEVRIEGPRGLLQHVATVSDAEELVRVEKTTADGFLQDITVRSDLPGVEIRAQLDRLAIVATTRLVVLERPGPVDVVVLARGDAYWARDGETERRGDNLRLDGKIAR